MASRTYKRDKYGRFAGGSGGGRGGFTTVGKAGGFTSASGAAAARAKAAKGSTVSRGSSAQSAAAKRTLRNARIRTTIASGAGGALAGGFIAGNSAAVRGGVAGLAGGASQARALSVTGKGKIVSARGARAERIARQTTTIATGAYIATGAAQLGIPVAKQRISIRAERNNYTPRASTGPKVARKRRGAYRITNA